MDDDEGEEEDDEEEDDDDEKTFISEEGVSLVWRKKTTRVLLSLSLSLSLSVSILMVQWSGQPALHCRVDCVRMDAPAARDTFLSLSLSLSLRGHNQKMMF